MCNCCNCVIVAQGDSTPSQWEVEETVRFKELYDQDHDGKLNPQEQLRWVAPNSYGSAREEVRNPCLVSLNTDERGVKWKMECFIDYSSMSSVSWQCPGVERGMGLRVYLHVHLIMSPLCSIGSSSHQGNGS